MPRSMTARRVWVWLDAANPVEAAALARFEAMRSMPTRVRAAMMREIVCRGLNGGGPVSEPSFIPFRSVQADPAEQDEGGGTERVVEPSPVRLMPPRLERAAVDRVKTVKRIEPKPEVVAAPGKVDPAVPVRDDSGGVGNLMW